MNSSLKWMTLGLALGFSASFGVSCGPAKCTAQNCAFGCCDASGTCQAGSADSQCGSSGNACMQCVLGQSCQLGRCVGNNTGTGGGFGGGSGQGGGTSSGGGTGTGGGTATGGGTGGGTSTGGGGGTTGTCAQLNSAQDTVFAGRTTCGAAEKDPNLLAKCNAAIGACSSSSDQSALASFVTCMNQVTPCTSGNEAAAEGGLQSCVFGFFEVASTNCRNAFIGSSTGGGGGTTGGGGGTTGGGGGTTGGGGGSTGGGGGSTTTCTTLSSFNGQRTDAAYGTDSSGYEITLGLGSDAATDPSNFLRMELVWAINGTATGAMPGTRDLALEGTYFDCAFCATMQRACTPGNTPECTGGSYLARAGTMTISSAPRTTTGTFSGTLSNVRFEEWNLGSDTPVVPGRCFIVPSANISATVAP